MEKERIQNEAKALIEMYQAGWYDAYNLKKRHKILWKNIARKCEISFKKRFEKKEKV